MYCCLKKNQNAPRPSEHPPVRRGGNVKTFRWDLLLLSSPCSVRRTVSLDTFWRRSSRGHNRRKATQPSFCCTCLSFYREKGSALPFPPRPWSRILCTHDIIIVLHVLGMMFYAFYVCIRYVWSTPVAQSAPRNLLTRWDVSSIPANGIFLTKN